MRSFCDGLPVIGDNFALTALRIKATNQLNGQIDNLNGVVEAMFPLWDGEEFGDYGVSSNPGEILNWLANGPANAKPLTDRFNVANIGAFADLCRTKGWKCDYVLDSDMSVLNAMTLVSAAGRTLGVGWEDGLLSVSIDNEREAPDQVFSGRNVKNFRGTISFPEMLHGVKVSFFDASTGYQPQTRTVYAEGYDETTAELFERIDAPTKTDAAEAYVVGWRYLAIRKLRPEIYEFDTDIEGLVVHFGSRVDIAHTRMAVGIRGARVRSVITREDGWVTGFVIDEIVPMEAGTSYVLRAQRGTSVGLFNIETVPGSTDTLTLTEPVPAANAPLAGNPCVFGVQGKETLPALVVGIATAEDKSSHLTCIPYVPALLADAGDIPAWDPKITPRALAEPIATGHVSDTLRRSLDEETIPRLANQQAGTEASVDRLVAAKEAADVVMDEAAALLAQATLSLADEVQKSAQRGTKQRTALVAEFTKGINRIRASITEELTVLVDTDTALAQRTTTIEAQLSGLGTDEGSVAAAISEASTAYVTPLAGVSSTVDMHTAQLSGMGTGVGSVAAAISEASTAYVTPLAGVSSTVDTHTAQLSGMGTDAGSVAAAISDASTAYVSTTAALSSRLDAQEAIFGDNESSALFKAYATAATGGASASGKFTFTATDGVHTAEAGIGVDVVVSGGLTISRAWIDADIFEIISGRASFIADDGTAFAAFDGATKTLIMDRLPGITLITAWNYGSANFTGATIDTGVYPLPADPAEVEIQNGAVVGFGDIAGGVGFGRYLTVPAGKTRTLEFRLSFRVQSGSSVATVRGGMKYQTGLTSWAEVPNSRAYTTTSATNSKVTMKIKGAIPGTDATNVQIWVQNSTGNSIWFTTCGAEASLGKA